MQTFKTATSAWSASRVSTLLVSSSWHPHLLLFCSFFVLKVWFSVYPSAFTSTLYLSIFTAFLFFFFTLYSLHVYISFTGKSLRPSPCQYLCCGECCPLFPPFYPLNISPNQLIYFPISIFSPLPLLPSPLLWISNIKAENEKKWPIRECSGRGNYWKGSKWSRHKQIGQ